MCFHSDVTKEVIRKQEGLLSFLWVTPGFLAFELFHYQWWRVFHSGPMTFLGILGLWWGIGMLLAISGLRRGSRINVLASLGTLFWLLYFLF